MKQPPDLDEVQRQMQPGVITLTGFLGSDRRSLEEILDEDENTVHRLGLSHRQIAERLGYFTERARAGLGTRVPVDDEYDVYIEEFRGGLPCPWGGRGMHEKCIVHFRNRRTGEELKWSELTVHLIRDHGFYGGGGSTYRIDPATARRALGL